MTISGIGTCVYPQAVTTVGKAAASDAMQAPQLGAPQKTTTSTSDAKSTAGGLDTLASALAKLQIDPQFAQKLKDYQNGLDASAKSDAKPHWDHYGLDETAATKGGHMDHHGVADPGHMTHHGVADPGHMTHHGIVDASQITGAKDQSKLHQHLQTPPPVDLSGGNAAKLMSSSLADLLFSDSAATA